MFVNLSLGNSRFYDFQFCLLIFREIHGHVITPATGALEGTLSTNTSFSHGHRPFCDIKVAKLQRYHNQNFLKLVNSLIVYLTFNLTGGPNGDHLPSLFVLGTKIGQTVSKKWLYSSLCQTASL